MTIHTKLDAVLDPIDSALGLPNEHYVSPEIFQEERRSVLYSNWAGIGFGKDIPNRGDVKPIDFLGMPLLAVRDQDDTIRVFQNTCRHRGMILVNEPKNIRGVIRCPYHSWCYAMNGALKTTPHVGGPGQNTHDGIDRSELGLIEIPSHVWHDTIFVNVLGNAPSFEEATGDLTTERWKEFDQPLYHGGLDSSFKLQVKSNWKLAIENYCESYHLPWVHPGLNSYSRLEDHYHIDNPGHYSGQGTYVYRQLKGDDGSAFPDFANLSEKWDEGAEYIAVFPNVLFGVHRDHFFSIIIEPIDHENTVEHIEIYYTDPSVLEDHQKALREKNSAQWKVVFTEDIFVVEGMQKGRHGDLFDGGKFSPVMDNPTYTFHKWVAEKVNKGRAA